MKRQNLFKTLLLAVVFTIPSLLSAQVDSRGTDFWVTFGSNNGRSIGTGNMQVNLQIRIVGAGQAATGHIHFTELGTSIPFSVTANGIFTHPLTVEEGNAVYNNHVHGTSNRSARITSSAPVIVYALNQSVATTDATNVLPTPVLGIDYFQISYAGANAYAVIATENTTRVYENGVLVATLNAGQVFYQPWGAPIGTRITSDKPIAFFTLAACIHILNSACDTQFQQFPPVNTWGRNFFVPVTQLGRERVRIVASQDGTNITQVGGTLITNTGGQTTLNNLNTGEWVELEILLSGRGTLIQANNPVGVVSFMVHFLSGQGVSSIPVGDPSTAWIPAIEQMIPSATIAPFIPQGVTALTHHFALVVVQTVYRDLTTMAVGGGMPAPLSGGTWYDHPTAGFSYYILQLPDNAALSYTFSNPEGLLAMGYGLGGHESYYYTTGSAFRTLDAAFFVNNIHNQDLIANPLSTNHLIFRAEIQGDMSTNLGHIRWFIDGAEETSATDQLTWNKYLPNGTYLVVLEVLMDDNVTVRRIEGTLIVAATINIIVNPHMRKVINIPED